jgi:hypothetical protein
MLPREGGTPLTLHETASRIAILIFGRGNPDVASALLHDDAEDDALLDADLHQVKSKI